MLADFDSIRRQVALIDDGEITRNDRNEFFYVIPPRPDSKSVVYTTKINSICRITESLTIAPHCGIIARYGIPGSEDMEWVKECASRRRLLFLGDCDPFDLLVYFALKSVFEIEYLGVSDSLISRMDVQVKASLTIPLIDGEARALELILTESEQVKQLVGSNCFDMLLSGRKMEVEAVVSYAREPLHKLFDIVP